MSGREKRGCRTHAAGPTPQDLETATLHSRAALVVPPPIEAVHTLCSHGHRKLEASLAVLLNTVAQVGSADCCLSELGTF